MPPIMQKIDIAKIETAAAAVSPARAPTRERRR
jgi:hypothetical protein